MADAEDFLNCGNSRNCFQNTIFQQSTHAGQAGLAAQSLSWFSVKRHLADDVGHSHHLENSLTPPVASVITVRAATTACKSGCLSLCWGQSDCFDFVCWGFVRLLAFW